MREVEDYVKKVQGGQNIPETKKMPEVARKSADIQSLETALKQALGTKVEIKLKKDPSKGTVVLHFYSVTDFDKIVNMLKK